MEKAEAIFKYKIDNGSSPGERQIQMPMGAEILSIQEQDGALCVWARVDPSRANKERDFLLLWTGQEFYKNPCDIWKFIGTVQIRGLVVHVFEIIQ